MTTPKRNPITHTTKNTTAMKSIARVASAESSTSSTSPVPPTPAGEQAVPPGAGQQTAPPVPVTPAPPGTSTPPATPGTTLPAAPVAVVQLINLPLQALIQAVATSMRDIDDIRAQLPNPTRLTTADRKHTAGRLKDGESGVLQIVADIAMMPAYAPLVASLASLDNGVDPTHFEPQLLEDWLRKVDALQPLVAALVSLGQDLGDTVMQLKSTARPPLLKAYDIFKIHAKTDPILQGLLKDVIDFYAAFAAAALKTKEAKKAAAAAAPAAPAAPVAPPAPAAPAKS